MVFKDAITGQILLKKYVQQETNKLGLMDKIVGKIL
jgi:hypothetical protein